MGHNTTMKFPTTLIILVSCLVGIGMASICLDIAPDADFNAVKFEGRWYEIAKIQTPGGAFFQRNCVCNTMVFTQTEGATNGDADVTYQCKNKTPEGNFITYDTRLYDMKKPGSWTQEGISSVSWTVLIQGEEYGMTYDCGGSIIQNYCVHILSRTPTLNPVILQELVALAEAEGLNPNKLPTGMINHDECW